MRPLDPRSACAVLAPGLALTLLAGCSSGAPSASAARPDGEPPTQKRVEKKARQLVSMLLTAAA